jgi:hypothetical protein
MKLLTAERSRSEVHREHYRKPMVLPRQGVRSAIHPGRASSRRLAMPKADRERRGGSEVESRRGAVVRLGSQ